MPTAELDLDLLDGFQLRIGSEVIDLSDVAQRLVALLALHRRPLRRSVVAGTLWPEKTEARASANLRSSLWRLNDTGQRAAIRCHGATLALDPAITVDVTELERSGWELLDGASAPTKNFGSDCFARELLPGWYEDWVLIERERLGQIQIRFLEALVGHLRRQGEFARAIDHAMRLVAIDPLRERSQLALVQTLLDEGSWGRARQTAVAYRVLLEDSFGAGTAAGFVKTYRSMLLYGSPSALSS